MSDCSKDLTCIDKYVSLHLKIAAIVSILVGSALGVVIPLVFTNFSKTKLFLAGQCFSAGVILATGFVHILPDAFEALTNPCLNEHPWGKFPFTGFISMITAVLVLLMDSLAHRYYVQKAASKMPSSSAVERSNSGSRRVSDVDIEVGQMQQVQQSHGDHKHAIVDSTIKNKVVAQILEFGILAHSVIIGIALGASQSPCTIRPLVGALVFHQLFEGLALGSCISLGDFTNIFKFLMGLFFSITTPGGIGIGIVISSSYNENDPKALIIQGVFDAASSGILVSMSIMDLLAAKFLSEEFLQQPWGDYMLAVISLFLGTGAMSVLAIWA